MTSGLRYLVERLADAGVLVHCCAADPPVALLQEAGVRGVLVDIDQLDGSAWDAVGSALEAGLEVGLGALPTNALGTCPDQIARRVMSALGDLGVEPIRSGQLMLTPACGLAGANPDEAVRALRAVRTAADIVTEQLRLLTRAGGSGTMSPCRSSSSASCRPCCWASPSARPGSAPATSTARWVHC